MLTVSQLQNLSPAGRSPGPNESAAVFSLPLWPFQLNSRIESQLAKGRDSSLTAERKIKPPASAQEANANFKIKGGLGTYTDPDEKQTNQMPSATNAPTSKPILFGFAIAKLCSSSAPLLPAEAHAKFRR